MGTYSLVAGVGFFIALTSRIVENFACDYSACFLLALSPSHRINRHLEDFSSLTHDLRVIATRPSIHIVATRTS